MIAWRVSFNFFFEMPGGIRPTGHNIMNSTIFQRNLETLSDAIDICQSVQLSFSDAAQSGLSDVDFAISFQTVTYNIGRQTGKTTAMCRLAKATDLIICRHLHAEIAILSKLRSQRATEDIPSLLKIDKIQHSRRRPYHTVWVDDASCYNKELISRIYHQYAGDCNQFVLLG